MFDALLILVGVVVTMASVVAASRPMPQTDPYYV
jgi:hypothetical protein